MELARRFASPYLLCRLQGTRAPGPSAQWRHRGSAACQLLHSMLAAGRSVLGDTFATGQLMKRACGHGNMEVASLEPRKGHGIPAMQRRGSGAILGTLHSQAHQEVGPVTMVSPVTLASGGRASSARVHVHDQHYRRERCVSQAGVVQAPQSTDDARRSKARCKWAQIGQAGQPSSFARVSA